MTEPDADEEFPGPSFNGGVVTEPALSSEEWDSVCAAAGMTLSNFQREAINQSLWSCAWEKGNREVIPRMSEVKRRLRSFIRGVDQTLDAVGYLEASGLNTVTSAPPIVTRVRKGKAGRVWLALVLAATSDSWKGGYWTKRALGDIPEADDTLSALHALGYTAGRALEAWEDDKGGRQGGGDRHFIWRLLQILDEAGVDISYGQDRLAYGETADERGSEPMSGAGWKALVHIWSLRPEAFTAGEKSTLGTYYRGAYTRLRNKPDKSLRG